MANGVRTYEIKINGLQQSIDAVESLNKQLDALEQKMKALNAVKIPSGGSSTPRNNTSALSEEEKLAKQIKQIDEKREAYSKEIYQNYLAAKDVLKETVNDQKQIAAAERLQADAYSNTMSGMKQKLADIKSAMQTVDLGDAETFKKMTSEANRLNEKLLEIEKSYGQFGRQVGNYKSAFEGLDKVSVTVAGSTREFSSAREALKTLNNELKTMAVNGQQDTEQFKQLRQTVMELESAVNDAKKPMDSLMDAMESFTAIASISNGFSALFGFDDTEIQRSIQKLVALQNILKGIETINKQIQTGEGIGGWIRPFTTQIDGAIAKMVTLQTTMKGVSVTSKAMVISLKAATLALKAFKAAMSFGITIAIDIVMEKVLEFVETLKEGDKELEKQKKYLEDTQGAYAKAGAEITSYKNKVESFNGTKAQENKLVEELNSKYGKSLGTYKSLAEWKQVLKERGEAYAQAMLKEAEAQALLNMYTEAYINLQKVQANIDAGEYHHWYQTAAGDAAADARELAKATEEVEKALDSYNKKMKEIDDYNKDNKLFDYAPQIKKAGKDAKDAVNEIEKEIAQARISAMKEGLNKTITQLEEERKQRLAKLKKNATMYKKYEKDINAIYDNRILEARKTWAEQMEKVNRDMWHKIYADTLSETKRTEALIKQQTDMMREKLKGVRSDDYKNQSISSYGIQGKNQLSPMSSFSLNLVSNNKSKIVEDTKELMDLSREAQAIANRLMATQIEYKRTVDTLSNEEKIVIEASIREYKRELDERKKALDEWKSYMSKEYDPSQVEGIFKSLSDESYSSSLAVQFEQAMGLTEKFWQQRIGVEEMQAKKLYEQQKKVRKEEYTAELREAKEHHDEIFDQANEYQKKMLDGLKGQLNAGLLTQEQYNRQVEDVNRNRDEAVERNTVQFLEKSRQLEAQYNNDIIQLETQRNDTVRSVNKEAYEARLQEMRDFQTAMSNLEEKQPVINAWGITNFKETNKNYRNLLSAYEASAREIVTQRVKASKDYQGGLIDEETYRSTLRELDVFAADLGEKMDEVRGKLNIGEQIGQFINDINQYVQVIGQSINQVLTTIWDAQDASYDKMMEDLEKDIDAQQEIYDKQEELANEHKDKMNDIEDELSTARGDRRQHLIDQLNAEMAAQRQALQEQKKAEKEKEKLEKKKEREELAQRKREHKRQVTQAIISAALAAVNGFATQPFVPVGLAMGALATALGAAQVAIISSQKYASGGVIEGKSHAKGGVKVLGGRAEVEGGEFITNKRTTAQNVELLEYINSRKRRIDLSDMIEFYSSGKTKKNITSMSPRTKFADGGALPMLNNNYTFDDRLLNAFEKYSEREQVVQVVDIIDRMNNVKAVQTLAGLAPNY